MAKHYNLSLLTLLFLAMPFSIKAQNKILVSNTDINLIENGKYISVDFLNTWGGTRLSIDFGQKKSIFNSRIAKDEKGKKIKFYSKIHAINVLADNGWVYIDKYDFVLSSYSEIESNSYLFKKLY